MPHFEKIYKVEKLSEVSEDMDIESFEYSKRLLNISTLREYGEYDICVDIDYENEYPSVRTYCEVRTFLKRTDIGKIVGGEWLDEGFEYRFGPIPVQHIHEDSVLIQVRMWAVEDEPKTSATTHLSNILKSMLNADDGDLTLVSREGREINAHAAVFKAASPAFQAMLTADMQEQNERRIVFKDLGLIGLNVLKEVVYLGLYSEQFKKASIEELKELLCTGEKYALVGLRGKAALQLLTHLNAENAFELYAFMKKFELRDKMCNIVAYLKKGRNIQIVLDKICEEHE